MLKASHRLHELFLFPCYSVRMRALLIPLLFFALMLSLGLNVFLLWSISEQSRVVRVVDGDSFDLSDGRRIRLLSVDAPEKDRCGHDAARQRLSDLLAYKHVTLTDTVTDDYGRMLANVFAGETFINDVMLREGLVRFTYVTSSRYDEVKKTFQSAKEEKRGIWGPPCRTTIAPDTCTIKANIRHGKHSYYVPSCRYYPDVIIDESFGDRWFCTQDEARSAGFSPAVSCE